MASSADPTTEGAREAVTSLFSGYRKLVDDALEIVLPAADPQAALHEAMRYSVFAGGKRLRPILVLAAGEACGAERGSVLPAACAVELIHTYSLVHDDLPSFDDDELRRGHPTNHTVYGDAIAPTDPDGNPVTSPPAAAADPRLEGLYRDCASTDINGEPALDLHLQGGRDVSGLPGVVAAGGSDYSILGFARDRMRSGCLCNRPWSA